MIYFEAQLLKLQVNLNQIFNPVPVPTSTFVTYDFATLHFYTKTQNQNSNYIPKSYLKSSPTNTEQTCPSF